MNISIRNVNNCEKLDESRVEDLMKKLNIKFDSDLSDDGDKKKACNMIRKKTNDINPCGITLYDDKNYL